MRTRSFLLTGLLFTLTASGAYAEEAKTPAVPYNEQMIVRHVPDGWEDIATLGDVKILRHPKLGAHVVIRRDFPFTDSAKETLALEAHCLPRQATMKVPVTGDDIFALFVSHIPIGRTKGSPKVVFISVKKRMPESRTTALTYIAEWPAKYDKKLRKDFDEIVAETRLE